MRFRINIMISLAGMLVSFLLQAQPNKYGVPLITNYPYTETKGTEQNWCITQDHRGVVYVGNHDKGVLEYDGVEWRTIPVPNNVTVRSMVTGDDGVVYVGAEGEFGMLEPDRYGKLQFISLYDSTLHDQFPDIIVWKTYFEDGKTFFCCSNVIFVYNPPANDISILETPENAFYAFFVNRKLCILDWGNGLMVHNGDAFVTVPGGEFFHEKFITGMEQLDDNQLLVSTMDDGIFLFDFDHGTADDSFLDPALMELFIASEVPYMTILNDQILVCTFGRGLYILDRNGEVQEIISESEGLDDGTIPHVYSDEQLKGSGPIWIAHWKGVSKVEVNTPFRLLTKNAGFNKLITDITYFNDRLYVSTFEGLFQMVSGSQGVGFTPVEDLQIPIWDLCVVEPLPGRSFLVATSDLEAFVIDKQMKVAAMRDLMVNPPDTEEEIEQISGRYIFADPEYKDIIYLGYTQLVGLRYTGGRWREISRIRNLHEEIFQMMKDKYGYLWISSLQYVIRIDMALTHEATMRFFSTEHGLPASEDYNVFLHPENQEVLVGTKDGFYRFDYFNDQFMPDTFFNTILPPGENSIRAMHQDRDGDYWLSFENQYKGWAELVARKTGDQLKVISENPFQRLPNASVDVFTDDNENGVWFSKSDELYHFDKSFSTNDTLHFQTLIRKVIINGDSVLYHGSNYKENGHGGYSIHLFQEEDTQPVIKYRYNNIEFHWAAPYFEQEENLLYSYKLVGFSEEWSDWNKASYKEFTNLKYGHYTLFVESRNVYGYEGGAASYSFVISRPWHASIPAIISYILLSGLLVFLIIKLYTRRLKNENLRLEEIIEERTAEIRKQKEELTDSIEYASRIQRAMLPSDELMDENNIDHFILFRPRDIVSGDFYWIGSKGDKLLIVAADCTGHGVPGAFMSMLGMTFLDEIVIKSEITSTDEVMEALREHVINSLEQTGKSMEEAVKDGMDLAMISVDLKTNNIQYSGAYNPLYLVRKLKRSEKAKLTRGEELELPRGSIHDENHVLIQIKADQMPIGVSEKDMRFTSTTLRDEGYNIYMFSDGFLDQFGGPQGKKFMSKNFKKLLLELQSVPLGEQGSALEKVLLGWMGEISQIDDILVMGLRVNPL
ncbi:MAG: SpoIIE family protein phosphatase [Bacteroidota bacterium]